MRSYDILWGMAAVQNELVLHIYVQWQYKRSKHSLFIYNFVVETVFNLLPQKDSKRKYQIIYYDNTPSTIEMAWANAIFTISQVLLLLTKHIAAQHST